MPKLLLTRKVTRTKKVSVYLIKQNNISMALRVGSDTVQPVRCVRDLGIYIDNDVSMQTHISRTMSNCFSALRQLRSIRRSVRQPVLL